jgi:hypothetical protein
MSAEDIVLQQVVNQGGSGVPLARDNSDFVFDCGVWCIVRAVVGTVTGVVVLLLCIYLTRDKWARQREDEDPSNV